MTVNKYKPLKEGSFDMSVPAEKKNLHVIRELLRIAMKDAGFSFRKTANLELSVIEHCENLIKYAYTNGDGEIKIKADLRYPVAKIIVKDTEREFDMSKQKLPELSGRIVRGIGGKMGIRTILSMCDEIKYKRKNGHNENIFIIRDDGN